MILSKKFSDQFEELKESVIKAIQAIISDAEAIAVSPTHKIKMNPNDDTCGDYIENLYHDGKVSVSSGVFGERMEESDLCYFGLEQLILILKELENARFKIVQQIE
jgi:hypothetical protein